MNYIAVQEVRAHIERLRINFPDLAEDADAWAVALEGETDLHELLTRIVREEREAVAFAEAIGTHIKTLHRRAARFERKHDALSGFMLALMQTAAQQKVVLPEATLSVSKSRPKVIVTDASELPDEYVKITREPMKQELSTALLGGKAIPGAMLDNSPPRLMVRQA